MEKQPQYSPPATHEFFRAALEDPRRPIDRLIRQNVRDINITGIYFFTPASLGDIAETYSLTIARISKIAKDTTRQIYQLSSPSLQNRFDLDEILARKPLSIRIRRRQSLGKGGRSVLAEKLVKENATPAELKKKLRISGEELYKFRKILKSWGVDLPYQNRPKSLNPELTRKLRRPQNPTETKVLLDNVNLRFYYRDQASARRVLMPVKQIASKDFLVSNTKVRLFTQSLRNAGVPVCQISRTERSNDITNYYLIARYDRFWAKAVLRHDPTLSHLRKKKT